MNSTETGQKQNAYQIVVTNERDKTIVWDSKKVLSGNSTDIRYNGITLDPENAYTWSLTVWD